VFPSRRGGWLTNGKVRWVFDPAVRTVNAAVDATRQQEAEQTGDAQTPKFPIITPRLVAHLRVACY
jgi:hypothetical protein